MNTKHTPRDSSWPLPETRTPAAPSSQQSETPCHMHRRRDFGIGYGNSSGYGSERHYTDGHADPIFRCV